ncbi:MAG TPA: hypothetical protein VNY25_10000 [Steroidobacteraceae bacterium]|jgi:hypothetical protein|nr:hypothetical protein [Steroidobacteraceae bacterium]
MRISTVIKALLAATAITPLLCQAESNVNTGGGSPLATTAHVDFQIAIPKFVFLRIGTGPGTVAGGWAAGGSIDLISFAPTPAQVGTGPLAALAASGDLGNGTETAVVVANNGTVTLSSTTTGALSDGTGDNLSFATITTAAAHNTSATTLAAPALADGVTTSVPIAAVGKIVQQDAKWTYSYSNATIPPAGTYGGVNVNNGRVTYTASVL